MARVTVVAHAQKDQGNCMDCGKPIVKGDPYKWAHPKNMGVAKVHVNCRLRASWLTSSGHLQNIYGAQEGYEDADPQTARDVADALEDVRSVAEVERDAYGQSADNLEQGFGHSTSSSDETRGKSDACDSWEQELQQAIDIATSLADEIDELESEKTKLEDGDYEEGMDEDSAQERIDEIDGEIDDRNNEAIEAGQNAVDSLSL